MFILGQSFLSLITRLNLAAIMSHSEAGSAFITILLKIVTAQSKNAGAG